MKSILKLLIYVILASVILFAFFLGYSTIADYKPTPIELLSQAKGDVVDVNDTLKVFNWNIGYCGLGDDMSFFYDGGEKVRTSKKRTQENIAGILDVIKAHQTFDFLLFQEVDISSRRSYKTNQSDLIMNALEGYHKNLAINYKVTFVPVPPSNPMGKVNGGIAAFSKFEPFDVTRHSFLGNYAWPKGLFMLDRCFMVQRYNTSDGKQLLVVNTHNEAYDTGFLRKEQMKMLKEFLLEEYKNGNYIMVGGDWNQNPPIPGEESTVSTEGHLTRIRIASDFMPEGWQWIYSSTIPTNRMIDKAYDIKTSETTVIDFFLLSPNLNKVTSEAIDLQFKNSDHNPVILSFKFVAN
jgi:exonuclease III